MKNITITCDDSTFELLHQIINKLKAETFYKVWKESWKYDSMAREWDVEVRWEE